MIERISLKDYVFSEKFLEDLVGNNIVIYEDEGDFGFLKENKDNILFLSDFENLEEFKKFLLKEKNKKFILVLNEINVDNFWEFENLQIIDVNGGIFSVSSKLKFDGDIMNFLSSKWKILLPYDLESFKKLLKYENDKVILKIYDFDVDENIMNLGLFQDIDGYVFLTDENFYYEGILLLTAGNFFPQGVYLYRMLNDKGVKTNLVGFYDLDFKNIEKLKKFTDSTKIFVISDIFNTAKSQLYLLEKLGLKRDNVRFLLPNTDNINTIYPEFLLESSNFDELSLMDKILQDL